MKRLKSLLVLLFFCTLGLISHAQESSLPEGFTTGNTVWIVRTGVSLNFVTGDGVDDMKTDWAAQKSYGEFKNTYGGNAFVGFYSPLGSSPVYFGLNAGVGMRSYKTSVKWKENISNLTTQETQLTAFNVQISPLNVGYIVKLNKSILGERFKTLDFKLF